VLPSDIALSHEAKHPVIHIATNGDVWCHEIHEGRGAREILTLSVLRGLQGPEVFASSPHIHIVLVLRDPSALQ
jgi:hypothetical protein